MSPRDVLARTDLAAVLTELSGEPVGHGEGARWHCPDRTHPDERPSVTMHIAHDGLARWRCWSGGHGGTAIDAVIAHHGGRVRDALTFLETRTSTTSTAATVAPRRPSPAAKFSDAAQAWVHACAEILWTPTGAHARDWLHRRGLPDRVLRANLVGFDPGPRVLARADGLRRSRGVVFASFDQAGRLVYAQTRHLHPGVSKYVNPNPEHGPTPALCFPRDPRGPIDRGPIIVTEGVPDGLTAVTLGCRNASVLSAAMVNDRTARELATIGARLILAFDNDPPGRHATRQLMARLTPHRLDVSVARFADGHDLTDTYRTRPNVAVHASAR